jgi:4-amino-4-deoxy-L-arabinose transferase-like glycosyltransferase
MATALIRPSQGKAPVISRARTGLELLVLAAFCGFLFFFGLGALGLVGADEPRYAQIAREMLARRDWVTPVLYGVPWLEKPILYYWEAMLSFRLFGASDWAARVPSAVNASAMVFAVYAFMRRFGSGLDAALIVASCAGVIGFARAASTDMPLTAMFTMAMLSWLAWSLEDGRHPERRVAPPGSPTSAQRLLGWKRRISREPRKLWLASFYIFLALGTLAKGPVAPFLAAVILVIFAALRREWRLIAQTLWLPGIVLFFVVAAPWSIAVQMATHDFFRVFILQHNLARFGSNIYHHPEPFWFYGAVVPLSVLPWLALVVGGFAAAFRTPSAGLPPAQETNAAPNLAANAASDTAARNADERANFLLFCVAWALVPALFFSLSQSKLPGYTLPAIPPLGLLAADFLYRLTIEGRRRFSVILPHALVAGAFVGAALLSARFATDAKPPAAAWTTAALVAGATFLVMAVWIAARGLRLLRIATLIPIVIALTFVIRFTAPLLDLKQSARPVAKELAQVAPARLAVAGYDIRRETEYGLAFYRNQPVANYGRDGVPSGEHILVSRSNDAGDSPLLRNRTVRRIGAFAPQKLYFYWVSATH